MSLRNKSITGPCAPLQYKLMGSWWSGQLVLLTGPCCSHFLADNYRKSISILFLLKAPCGSLWLSSLLIAGLSKIAKARNSSD